ncbi:UDP-glucose--hexose-1-phosphate uridylyltransferase [Paracholeplasma manati]|uniref:UDP-glucose--hexose-1-phosphate uridylyltransferase n=1 Tax=Paracholeplasma manati TaxID=591373 RepID=UPI00240863C9|nr:UDP-glucose--hexose-1-phosphate uridylyltransferase [Paracholeplasma manati]MDG0888177.1 UDP-glucose--hexose-1-phosphate uridylyltransferase [Paracholeplasma manati]
MNPLFALVTYGLKHQWIVDPNPSLHKLLQLYNLPLSPFKMVDEPIDLVMEKLLDLGFDLGLFEPNTLNERDAFEAYLFDFVMPSPSETKMTFLRLYQQNRRKAFDYLYHLSMDVNYIKTKRIAQNVSFHYPSIYGTIDLTINLSKPEKDPKDIAKALEQKDVPKTGPKCLICKENEHNYDNARMNLRIIPITLYKRLWHFQYSPYAYYNEHCIILSDDHTPMKMCEETFHYLLDFIDYNPDYFIGSNADIPIVGGSILDHDHFQGGKHHFPIESAKIIKSYQIQDLTLSHIYWPLSTIRLTSQNRDTLLKVSKRILNQWRTYDHEALDIISKSYGLHNTITPIARKVNDAYQIDIILRNNRVNEVYPEGIFHPHRDVQHIKKENIGLIEAMGLAILPGRLKTELAKGLDFILHGTIYPELAIHQPWLNALKQSNQVHNMADLEAAVGDKFKTVLEHAGVFKLNDSGIQAMDKFIQNCIQ